MAKDAQGHGSEGRGARPFDRSGIGMTASAQFSGKPLRGVSNQTDTQRTVADMRTRMQNTGPGHQTGLMQGIKNFLGG